MATINWQQQDKKYRDAVKDIEIPNGILEYVQYILPKSPQDFNLIPETGGCYWIWTDEPVLHSLHKNKTPLKFDGGEIIYNGIAKANVRHRVKNHLHNLDIDSGWSGISMDIYFGETQSHRKKGLSQKGKVPFIKKKITAKGNSKIKGYKKGEELEIFVPIRTREDLYSILISNAEKEQLMTNETGVIHFRNGINIFERKHQPFEFRVYYITDISALYLDYIEKRWREDYHLPKLCSYSSGR